MSLTVYPYTRKTWKKEVFEMLFENLFFHVDASTLEYSKAIIDNLISNDRTMFKDVLSTILIFLFLSNKNLIFILIQFFYVYSPSDLPTRRWFVQ